MAAGRVRIQYRRVECVPPTNLAVYVDQNFGQDKWLRLFVEVRHPCSLMSDQQDGNNL
jgi:hypothetical protein